MKEETTKKLSDATATVLSYALESLKAGIDFGKEQVPLYFQEYIKYEITISSIYLIMGFIGFVVMGWTIFSAKRYKGRDNSGWIVASVILFIISTATIAVQSKNLMKAYISPRVMVIEKLSNSLKGYN